MQVQILFWEKNILDISNRKQSKAHYILTEAITSQRGRGLGQTCAKNRSAVPYSSSICGFIIDE